MYKYCRQCTKYNTGTCNSYGGDTTWADNVVIHCTKRKFQGVNNMKVGDFVNVIDGSYTLKIANGKMAHSSGNELIADGTHVIVAINRDLPADNSCYETGFGEKQYNDTIISNINTGAVVFIKMACLKKI